MDDLKAQGCNYASDFMWTRQLRYGYDDDADVLTMHQVRLTAICVCEVAVL